MELDPLVRRTVSLDAAAWHALQAHVAPTIEAFVRAHAGMRRNGLSSEVDDVATVSLAVLERLQHANFKNLQRYLAQRELEKPVSFDSWLYGAADYAVREHLRKRYGRAPKPALTLLRAVPSKRDLNTKAEQLDEATLLSSLRRTLRMTDKLKIAEILRYVARHFSAHERRALELHFAEDRDLAELARLLELPDEHAAARLIRRLVARLRHRFNHAG